MARPKTLETQLNIKLSIKLLTAIKIGARDKGISVSEYIRYLAEAAQKPTQSTPEDLK